MVSICCVCIKSTAFPGREMTGFCLTYGVCRIYTCCKYEGLSEGLSSAILISLTFRKRGTVILLLDSQFWTAQFIPYIGVAILQWCCELQAHFKQTSNFFFLFGSSGMLFWRMNCFSLWTSEVIWLQVISYSIFVSSAWRLTFWNGYLPCKQVLYGLWLSNLCIQALLNKKEGCDVEYCNSFLNKMN